MSTGASCYYPNGNPSLEEDIPCDTGDAIACCPLNWSCQGNGLCYLENENYYGRYTCTSDSWASGCPNICTHDNTAGGNEAVLECEPGSYCCDANRPELSGGTNCCDASASRFSIDGVDEVNGTSSDAPAPGSSEAAYTSIYIGPDTSLSSSYSSSTPESSYSSATPDSVSSPTSSTVPPSTDTTSESFPTTSSSSETSSSLDEDSFTVISVSTLSTSGGSTSAITSEKSRPSGIATSTSLSDTSDLSSSPVVAPTLGPFTTLPDPQPPSSILPTTSSSPTPMIAAASTPITKSKGFIAGLTVGLIVAGLLLLVIALLFLRRRRRRPARPPQYPPATTALPVPIPYQYDSTAAPGDNPYAQPWPTSQATAINPATFGTGVVPDQYSGGGGNGRSQLNLLHAPAQNPYAVNGRSSLASVGESGQSATPQPGPQDRSQYIPYPGVGSGPQQWTGIPPRPPWVRNVSPATAVSATAGNPTPPPSYTTEDIGNRERW